MKTVAGESVIGPGDHAREAAVTAKVIRNLLPFMVLLYFVCQVDRGNISFAALTMNRDVGLTPQMYGFGAGIFFCGYFLFEVPSNLLMHRVGARVWMCRIMLSWGVLSAGMLWVHSSTSFYVLRFLLGLAEAGFVPGMFLFLSQWIPRSHIGRATGIFLIAAPLTTVVAGPLSVLLLELNGAWGLRGWQWMFLIEGLPAIILAFVILRVLPDRPEQASWLSANETDLLLRRLDMESRIAAGPHAQTVLRGFLSPAVRLLSMIWLTLVVGLYGVGFWLPQIVKGLGFSNLQTGFVIAVPYLLGALACYLWSVHSDRSGERRWHIALPCFLAAGGLVASALLGTQLLALIPITLAVIGLWAGGPVFWSVPGRHLSGVAAAAGLAVINSVGNLGGFAGPYLVGWVRASSGSFVLALIVLAAGPFVAGLLALCLPVEAPESEALAAGAQQGVARSG